MQSATQAREKTRSRVNSTYISTKIHGEGIGDASGAQLFWLIQELKSAVEQAHFGKEYTRHEILCGAVVVSFYESNQVDLNVWYEVYRYY